MNRDMISAFTLKIASSNGCGLISILYEIYEEYEKEALEQFKAGHVDQATAALSKCGEVVGHLQRDLNFDYKVSSNLYALYDYVKRCVARSIYRADSEGLRCGQNQRNAGKQIRSLSDGSFCDLINDQEWEVFDA